MGELVETSLETAKFGQPEITRGIIPGGGGTQEHGDAYLPAPGLFAAMERRQQRAGEIKRRAAAERKQR